MFKRAILLMLILSTALPVFGFALLGPYTDWMTWSNGYRRSDQLGGPMNIGAEYRWNLPVITYGFDREFIEYFGQDGIRAVRQAIGMITNLPPAAELILDDYQFRTVLINQEASQLNLLDLRSISLQMLLAQLGLAEPTRNIWTIRDRTNDSVNVILRNFDPVSLTPTNVLNGEAYDYFIYTYPDGAIEAVESPTDPTAIIFPTAADGSYRPGEFRYALSRDDAGALRYLYSRNNINVEPLPTGVTSVGNTNRPVPDVAPRPGVDKLSFLRMSWNTNLGKFNAVTSIFNLAYVTNGMARTQRVQRIVKQPDIVFEARDLGGVRGRATMGEYYFSPKFSRATDTTRWQNVSHLNGPSTAGPGVIPPGARLTFGKVGKYSSLGAFTPPDWGSFDDTPNGPLIFKGNERMETITLDNYIQREGTNSYFATVMLGVAGAVYQIDSSTNLIHWTPFTTVTNDDPYLGYFSFRDQVIAPKKFYRARRKAQP